MCVCSFDMLFTHVMSGWEGTANDARIFLECVANRENKFPLPPEGKYYVVDSGFTNMSGFLSPYRGERYHLADYRNSGRLPHGREELFNFRHSSRRNVIERCFGVLKKRFKILKSMPSYPLSTQKYIPIACCAVHNFIRIQDRRDRLFLEFEDVNAFIENGRENIGTITKDPVLINISQAQIRQMAHVRDAIADSIWESIGH